MRAAIPALWITAILAPVLAFADLEAIKSEPNLEKRSQKALDNASSRLEEARTAYQKGEVEVVDRALLEIQASVELSHESLKSTGKNARRSFKHFKKAEIATRQLLRRLDSFRNEMGFGEREKLEPTIHTVQKIHDELLHAIMGGGK